MALVGWSQLPGSSLCIIIADTMPDTCTHSHTVKITIYPHMRLKHNYEKSPLGSALRNLSVANLLRYVASGATCRKLPMHTSLSSSWNIWLRSPRDSALYCELYAKR